jgi:hypothetical protein
MLPVGPINSAHGRNLGGITKKKETQAGILDCFSGGMVAN